MTTELALVFCIALASGLVYIKLWGVFKNTTASGFGLLSCFPIIYAGLGLDNSVIPLTATLTLALTSFVYWFDDVVGLRPIIRLLLSLSAGFIIFFEVWL